MTDDEMITVLRGLGIDERSYSAVALLPLVQVAWADGRIQDAERAKIYQIAVERGMLEGDGDALLRGWLTHKPSAATFNRALVVMREVQNRTPANDHHENDLLSLCIDIAKVTGGLFNVFGNVDQRERALLASLTQILDGTAEIPLTTRLDSELPFAEDDEDITDAKGFFPEDISLDPTEESVASGPAIAVANDPSKRVALSDTSVTVGRRGDNTITLETDRQVSRQHCRLFAREGRWYIVDCGSVHGTWVNGEKIFKRQLFGGEQIQIGVYTLHFSV